MISATLSEDRLELPELFDPASGAVVRFTGTVRGTENGAPIAALEYAAYTTMALRELERLLRATAEAHGLSSARVVHRLGIVPVGEAAVILEVTAPHRTAAFAAIQEFMDRMKIDVPIWKIRAVSVE